MATIFVIALLLFGPEQLPKVARQLGEAMRHMQNTTQSFMLEMDRAARETDAAKEPVVPEAPVALTASEEAPSTEDVSSDAPAAEDETPT